MLHWCFSPGANRISSPLLAHAQGVGIVISDELEEASCQRNNISVLFIY